MLAAIREAERVMGLEAGAVVSDRRHRKLVRTRQVIMLIGTEEIGMSTSWLGRLLRRDHSTVVKGAAAMRGHIAREPWRGLHAHLLEHVRCGAPPPPAPPPAPRPEPVASTPPAEPPADRADDDVWPDRGWWERNNALFVAEMRRLHPERERDIRRREG